MLVARGDQEPDSQSFAYFNSSEHRRFEHQESGSCETEFFAEFFWNGEAGLIERGDRSSR